MELIGKISKILDKVFRIFLQVLVALLCIVILVQVFFRYFFENPLSWSEELARYCMIWITFIGVSIALNENSLSSVDLLVEIVPKSVKKIMLFISNVLMLVLTVILFKYSIDLLLLPGTTLQYSAGLGIPMWIVYLCGPIGLSVMSIQISIRLITNIANWNEEVSE